MAALIGVGGGAAPVLAEEQGQVALGVGEVLGVEGAQHHLERHPSVEALDQLVEERLAAEGVVDVDHGDGLARRVALSADRDGASGPAAWLVAGAGLGHRAPPPAPVAPPSRRKPWPKNPPLGRAWAW